MTAYEILIRHPRMRRFLSSYPMELPDSIYLDNAITEIERLLKTKKKITPRMIDSEVDSVITDAREQYGVNANPPFYAHNLYEKKTHGLNLKQMRRLYAMVSRGNQKAITYARNVLGIPFSETPTQVKAVVYHHVRDLAERRVRRNPFRSGGYLRETPKEAGYKVISLKGRQLILEDLADGKRELWARSPNFAGYAIFYKNNTYEFVTSVLPGMTPVLPRAGQPIKGNPFGGETLRSFKQKYKGFEIIVEIQPNTVLATWTNGDILESDRFSGYELDEIFEEVKARIDALKRRRK